MEGYEMIIVTAPRRFGKPTNLNMMKRFCEIIVDEKGNSVQRNLTENRKLFKKIILNVRKYDRVFLYEHFGNYPTIIVDVKSLRFNNYQLFIDSFKDLIIIA